MPRLVKIILIAVSIALIALLLSINTGIARLINDFAPGSLVWVHAALLLLEIICVAWLWFGLFGRSKYLMLRDTPTKEEREAFTEELLQRLRNNPRLDRSKLRDDDPAFLSRALRQLEEQANAEIVRSGQKVFLGTALSQNGRLDGLIVFVMLCRLIWRIAALYNQRPHPREILSLYLSVASSVFLALSLEESNLTTEITVGFGQMLQASAPAALTGGVPLLGSVLQTFTSSVIDGTANSFLTLRAGIVARNAYAYSIVGKTRPGRAAVFKEAGGMLLKLSNPLLEKMTKSIGNGLSGLGRMAQDSTIGVGKNIAGGIGAVGDGIAQAASSVADGTTGVVRATGGALYKTGSAVSNRVSQAASLTGKVLASPIKWVQKNKDGE